MLARVCQRTHESFKSLNGRDLHGDSDRPTGQDASSASRNGFSPVQQIMYLATIGVYG